MVTTEIDVLEMKAISVSHIFSHSYWLSQTTLIFIGLPSSPQCVYAF
jgi:hypothetical protein